MTNYWRYKIISLGIYFTHLSNHKICQVNFGKLLEMLLHNDPRSLHIYLLHALRVAQYMYLLHAYILAPCTADTMADTNQYRLVVGLKDFGFK
jgi:hypothetical protein